MQQGLARYNCADSLDRTNAATYFAAVQVLNSRCKQPKSTPEAFMWNLSLEVWRTCLWLL